MNASTADQIIGDAQIAQYNDKGYLVIDAIYSPAEVAEMRHALSEMVEKARGLTDHDSVYDLEPSHSPEDPRVRRIKSPTRFHPLFNQMGRHPRLIAALTGLLGTNLRMHGSKINLKAANHGSAVEWHQDWAFYPHTNDDVLAVGVMLDDMTEENGPLLVLPGTHKGPTYDHHQDGRFVGGIDLEASGLDVSPAATVTGRAGACSFHHVRAIHGSGPNLSKGDRRLLLFQVAAGDAWDLCGNREGSWEAYEATMIAGQASIEPRMVPAPIRLPYPGPLKEGSIYESQTVLRRKYFATAAGSDDATR